MHANVAGSSQIGSSSLLELWHSYRAVLLFLVAIAIIAIRAKFSIKSTKPEEVKEKHSLLPTVATNGPKRIAGKKTVRQSNQLPHFNHLSDPIQPIIFFSSLGGSTEAISQNLREELDEWSSVLDPETKILPAEYLDLSYVEYDDYFLNLPKKDSTKFLYLILLPTYNIDTTLNTFLDHLQETHHDFRIDTAPLAGLLGYSVFGFGDKEGWPTEEEGFCSQAKEVDKWMAKLTGRKRAFPLGMGDCKTDYKIRLGEWRAGIKEVLLELRNGNGLGEGYKGSGDAEESDNEEEVNESSKKSTLDDVEDLGTSYRKTAADAAPPLAIDFTTYNTSQPQSTSSAKEMVAESSPTYASLTKQGYTIVGSHSGVKICRWTKSALRGRGSCYKYSFYGIASHRCMETTPSLSCSNKCVFCWRHGTNPVGTVWRWKVDPPEMIFEGVKAGHYQKIKMLKGVPGVRADRFAEAMQIKHCALSLVGEPIFYPHINEFTSMLHNEHISTFLVCNAQHPDQLATLNHVTQLYVSIDASNKESLKKIDRPLHRDFWERFTRCLDILREQRNRQRTVFRLTLVKGFNIEDEVIGYANLIERSLPCFVEIKGVTFCGTSTSAGAGLTMANVPFYEEVCTFVRALDEELDKRGLGYGIAAEHAHSCCVLLASERFKKNGKWHTLIDYDMFFKCLESGNEFGPEDYIGEATPEWATWGQGGFDPRDERWYRKKKGKTIESKDAGSVAYEI
jgi:tRNA wybutosine-synthesizing protein 1